MAYTSDGRDTLITGPMGQTVAVKTSLNKKLITQTDSLGVAFRRYTDEYDRVMKTIDRTGYPTVFSYDDTAATPQSKKLPVKVQAPGYVSEVSYNNMDRIVSATTSAIDSEDELTVSRTYDSEGNILTATNATGGVVSYEYDELNRVISVTDALNNTTTYTRDNRGNVTGVTDALNNTTTFEYNRKGQLVKEIDALGGTTQYVRDILATSSRPLILRATKR